MNSGKDIIGKTILALRGIKQKGKETKLQFILFGDAGSFLELTEQDSYDYHDCNDYARVISVHSDETLWKKMLDKDGFDEPDHVGTYPFC